MKDLDPTTPDAELAGLDAARLMEAGIPPDRNHRNANELRGGWEPPAPEELSAMIPGYQITDFLGRGGMGAVYRAVQTRLDRTVAVKLLLPELTNDPGFQARFQREAKAMARLNHPNIVQIFDYGQAANGHHYFVMEFVDGSDLHRLVRSGHLDASDALNAVSQVCSALQYAHELGFVHRDIKPANILINQQGILKVGDFGLAKLIEKPGAQVPITEQMNLTMSGAAMGTPNYAAPEQLNGEGHVDHRADLYSLGVMFYEMLTREIPRGAPKPPSRKIASLDVRIDGVVFKAMDPDPDERYQTAVELRTDVDIIRTTPLPVPAADPPAEAEPHVSEVDLDSLHSDAAAQPAALRRRSMIPYQPDDMPANLGHPSAYTILTTTRSLNTTMLVLGCIAMLTIGGLALFLANRKTGDTSHFDTIVTNTVTNNSYFTQLISFGITTAKDLEDVIEFRPWRAGFVGMSKDGLSWTQVQELATRTGAEIVSVEDEAGGSRQELLAWLTTSYSSHLSSPVWVRERGEARLLNGAGILPVQELNSPRRALLQWGAVKPVVAAPRAPAAPAADQKPATPEVTVPTTPAPPKPEPATRDPLKWTNKTGKVIHAEFVSLSGDNVFVLMDGKQFRIPFSNLSPASVAQAKELGGRSR